MDFTSILDLWVKVVMMGTAAACLIALVMSAYELWRMPENAPADRRRTVHRYMAVSLAAAVLCTLSAWLGAHWNGQRSLESRDNRQTLQQQLHLARDYNRRFIERFDAFEEKMKERDQRIKDLTTEMLALARAGKLDGQDYTSVGQKLSLLNRDSEAMDRIVDDLQRLKLEADKKEQPAPPLPEAAPARGQSTAPSTASERQRGFSARALAQGSFPGWSQDGLN